MLTTHDRAVHVRCRDGHHQRAQRHPALTMPVWLWVVILILIIFIIFAIT
jgi:hypothetical protein